MSSLIPIRSALLLLAALSTVATASATVDVPRCADVSVAGIGLDDPKSVEAVVGTEIVLHDADLPYAHYLNRDRTESLELVFHPGSVFHSFNEFRVRKAQPSDRSANALKPVATFRTGKGIHLGMSKAEVMNTLGPPHHTSRSRGTVLLGYRLEHRTSSTFLRHYNMPTYYGHYRFKGDRLVDYAFGFEYP